LGRPWSRGALDIEGVEEAMRMSVTSLMSVSSWTSALRPLRNRLSSLDEESLEGSFEAIDEESGPRGRVGRRSGCAGRRG